MTLYHYFSNRLEFLYEELKASLYYSGLSPFARRLVIVPSTAMRAWLQLRIARDPDCGIAAGLEIGLLEQSLGKLCRWLAPQVLTAKMPHHPHEQELSFLFELLILNTIDQYPSFDEQQKTLWKPLLDYLKVYREKKSDKRLVALCDSLASLFTQYGRYGTKMLAEWEIGKVSSWQGELWRKLKGMNSKIIFPYQLFDLVQAKLDTDLPEGLPDLHIHLFGISFLAKKAHDFFLSIGKILDVRCYSLSPCQLFWSDICSDREAVRLKSYWAGQKVSIAQQVALDEFLRSRNVLLANFGRMGREVAKQVEESSVISRVRYFLPTSIIDLPQYDHDVTEETLFEPSKRPLSLLQAIQSDMVLLRTLDPTDKIDLDSLDQSLQLHIAPTRQREVEILYNTLVGLLSQSSKEPEPLTPGDVIVMVPDFEQYSAAISNVFGADDSVLDYQLADIPSAAKSPLIQGFLHLLAIASGRWEAQELLDLLKFPAFQKRQKFTFEDVHLIEKWIQKSGVYWGQTPEHRNVLLQRDHRQRSIIDSVPAGTWNYSHSRILYGLTQAPEHFDVADQCSVPPLEGVEISHMGLIGKWILLINSLKEDLQPLEDGTKMTLQDWSEYLICLKDTYFLIDSSNKDAEEEEATLTDLIKALGLSSKVTGSYVFNFAGIKTRLEKSIHDTCASLHEMHLQAVKFCPLLPMRALPSKILAIIGMQEQVFPKMDLYYSLNELSGNDSVDYSPSQSDFDRYLFLEALLSARKTLYLSYVGICPDDLKVSMPSLLIQELFTYVDDGYTIGGKRPSLHCTRKHPFDRFDSQYFSLTSDLKNYKQADYQLAKMYYNQIKSIPHRFISDFMICSASESELPEASFSIQELSTFASNPLKTYFNKTLGIYINVEEIQSVHEAFALGPLEKYQLRLEGIQKKFDPLITQAVKKGVLPQGMFKTLAVDDLRLEIENMHAHFDILGLVPQSLFTMVFSAHCESPYYSDKHTLMLPPLLLNDKAGRSIKIIGKLKEVSPLGLLFHRDRDFKSVMKIWPQYLAMQCAIEQFDLPIACQAISSKSNQPLDLQLQGAGELLTKYIDYYRIGLQSPSLLLPEWAEAVTENDSVALSKQMHAVFDNPFVTFYNDYFLWLFPNVEALPLPDTVLQIWGPLARDQFSGLLTLNKRKRSKIGSDETI